MIVAASLDKVTDEETLLVLTHGNDMIGERAGLHQSVLDGLRDVSGLTVGACHQRQALPDATAAR